MPYRLAIAQRRRDLTCKGGYRDSNPRPPEPQSGALTNCAIPTLQMCPKGFEPPTHGLEGRCSIQLSYGHTNVREKIRTPDTLVRSQVLYPAELHTRIAYCLSAVGVTGFEPATSWSQTRRSSQAEPHPEMI